MSEETREKVKDLGKHQENYDWGAYLSSGLTNVPDEQRSTLTETLERLYLDVFHPQRVFLYLPHLWSDPGHDANITPEDVHILDRLRIAEADFVVLCADYPSFGVGQEFEIAQAAGLRVLGFHHLSAKVSRMLLGGAAFHVESGGDTRRPSEALIIYDDYEDLKRKLLERTRELLSVLPRRETERVPMPSFGARLAAIMRQRGLDEHGLSEVTGFTPAFISFLLSSRSSPTDPKLVLGRWRLPDYGDLHDVTKYVNPGLWIIRQICRGLEISVHELVEEDLTPSEEMGGAIRNLIKRAAYKVVRDNNGTLAEYERLADEPESGLEVGLRAARGAAGSAESVEKLLEKRLQEIRQG